MLLHHSSCLFITIAWCWFSSLIVLVRRSYCVSLSQQFCIGLPVSLSLYNNSFVLVHHSYCLPLSQQFCVGSPIFLSRFITTVLCWFTTLLVSLYHFRFVLIHQSSCPSCKTFKSGNFSTWHHVSLSWTSRCLTHVNGISSGFHDSHQKKLLWLVVLSVRWRKNWIRL